METFTADDRQSPTADDRPLPGTDASSQQSLELASSVEPAAVPPATAGGILAALRKDVECEYYIFIILKFCVMFLFFIF
jgi:hypothetical protein